MENAEFQSIHEIGFTTLQKKLNRFKGKERAEVLSTSGNSASVVKSDSEESKNILSASVVFLEGVHFDLVYTPLQYLGHKLLTAACSRIYAMNGSPLISNIDLAIPNKLSVSMIETICSGFDEAAKAVGSSVSFGDITASHQFLTIATHTTGTVEDQHIVYRKGCKAGDQICVTGDLGAALAGLRILLREKKEWQESGAKEFRPDLENYEYVVQRQLMPSARHDLIRDMSDGSIKPTSMIELSRGLLNEIQLLMDANESGCEIFTPAVPISLQTRHVADEMKEDVDKYAFYGGEDYEMLFTLKPEHVEKLKTDFDDFTVIGEIKEKGEGIKLNTGEGQVVDLSNDRQTDVT